MSALSFFAPRSLPPDLATKTRSLTCLSLLCFALADVRDGLGPGPFWASSCKATAGRRTASATL